VLTTRDTKLSEKGARGRVQLRNGDHVHVRGFVAGRSIRAVSIRIFPSRRKPKPYSFRATVSALHGSLLTVQVGGRLVSVRLTAHTVVRIGSTPASASRLRQGAIVQLRVQPGAQGLVALSIRVFLARPTRKHVHIRGVLQYVRRTSVTVRANGATYNVSLTPSTVVYLGSGTVAASRRARTVRRCTERVLVELNGSVAVSGDAIRYVIDDHPLRIVATHSVIPGSIHGRLGEDELDWLDRTLAAQPRRPTVVMLHHPPFTTGLQHFDVVGMTDNAGFERVIAKHALQQLLILPSRQLASVETATIAVP